MRYVKAEKILPGNLVREIQKYMQGGYLYIPSQPDVKKGWGENTGSREYIRSRNEAICSKYKNGYAIASLAEEFFLSIDSIKKIVYSKKK